MRELVQLLAALSDPVLDSLIGDLEAVDEDQTLFICKALAARERRLRDDKSECEELPGGDT